MAEPLLAFDDLRISFRTERGVARAVNGVSFEIAAGEAVGVVGESGCGKSLTALAALRLITLPNVVIEGEIRYRGRNLLALSDREMRSVRGKEIAMVFQDPMTSFTPVHTIGAHIAEMVRAHESVSKAAARARALELLQEVGIADPRRRLDEYPHQLSGGMRQRAMIAMALACSPALLIADEPTTALDVTIQAQILSLLRRLRAEHGSAVMFITHDLGVVGEFAEEVKVMYAGRIIEHGPVREVLERPQHPYTWGLLDAVPRIGLRRSRRLATIPGTVASPFEPVAGCAFAPRCRHRHEACEARPPLAERAGGHPDACWLDPAERPALRAAATLAAVGEEVEPR